MDPQFVWLLVVEGVYLLVLTFMQVDTYRHMRRLEQDVRTLWNERHVETQPASALHLTSAPPERKQSR